MTIAFVVICVCFVAMYVLAIACLRTWRYWFNAFLSATRDLPPHVAIKHLDANPVTNFWRSLIPWRQLP